jgi:SMC interacting uncharacterized protein involved in chromosome segregation
MKKKEIKTKIQNALNFALFEIQLTPSRKIKKSITEFSEHFTTRIKAEMKAQIRSEKELGKKSKKTKKAKAVTGTIKPKLPVNSALG